jgi:RHS repeat-associated protein
MAYTAFGERRKGDWRVSDPLLPIILALTNRGFTGHEHIDEMGLIHMNGRAYDPQIGRFLSADPYIQAPYRGCRSGGSGFCQGCKKRVASPISRYICLGTRHILTRFLIKGSTLIATLFLHP